MNSRDILFIAMLIAGLSACSTGRQYVDNADLEKPPALATAGLQSSQANSEPISEQKAEKGLGNNIHLSQEKPLEIKLKRSFDTAWSDVEQALKQLNIEITDREHDKKQYYVTYDADDYQPEDSGFLEKSTSFFRNDYQVAVYILTFNEYSDETVISASLANASEQNSRSFMQDGTANNLTDGSDRLLQSLYRELRDNVVEE